MVSGPAQTARLVVRIAAERTGVKKKAGRGSKVAVAVAHFCERKAPQQLAGIQILGGSSHGPPSA